MKDALGGISAARFLQIENQLLMLIDLQVGFFATGDPLNLCQVHSEQQGPGLNHPRFRRK